MFSLALQRVEKDCSVDKLLKVFPEYTPRVKSRMKSVDSTVDKVKRKIKTEPDFIRWIRDQNYKEILLNQDGIGDYIGIRLIFPYISDFEAIIDQFISNYLVKNKNYEIIKGRDEKKRDSGYYALHSHVFVPFNYKKKQYKIPLEIQITSEMRDVWMEVQHRLIYKNENIEDKDTKYLEELYAALADLIGSLEIIIFLPEKYGKLK